MKVTLIATHSLESPGGGGRFFPLAKALTKLGYEVTMITLHHDYAQVTQKQFVQDSVCIKYVGQMHVHKSNNQKTYFNPLQLLWVTLTATLSLTWAALRTPTDIIHVCKAQPMNGLAAWIVHRLQGIPVFLDSDDLEAINNRFSGRWQQVIVTRFENWFPAFVCGMTVNTTYIAQHYINLGFPAARIVLVPNGVDRERFAILDEPHLHQKLVDYKKQLHIEPKQQVVVYVGSISLVSHGIDLLLQAFALVQRQRPETVLVLAGSGEDMEGLQQLAHQLGITANVRFAGRIPAVEVPYYYALGDVSTDPLRDDLAAASSFSLKLVEGIASCVPCVTTDMGDRKEAVGEAGLAVAAGDAQALAEGILTVLTDDDLAFKMKMAAQQIREQVWWDKRAELFSALYEVADCSKQHLQSQQQEATHY